jgi:hypothetical protein
LGSLACAASRVSLSAMRSRSCPHSRAIVSRIRRTSARTGSRRVMRTPGSQTACKSSEVRSRILSRSILCAVEVRRLPSACSSKSGDSRRTKRMPRPHATRRSPPSRAAPRSQAIVAPVRVIGHRSEPDGRRQSTSSSPWRLGDPLVRIPRRPRPTRSTDNLSFHQTTKASSHAASLLRRHLARAWRPNS